MAKNYPTSRKKAWSDGITFKKGIKFFQNHINKTTKERFLLLLDNCGPHGNKMIKKDKQVHVEFLPKNTTSAYQPMDAGSIAMLKKNYRYHLLKALVEM